MSTDPPRWTPATPPTTSTRPTSRTSGVTRPGGDPVTRRSLVNLDSIESASLGVLVDGLVVGCRLADARMREVCAALAIAVDCTA
ncbi:hypothetical protein [Lapillicoccus sp.]|uniref:hypothetical protein n=1 Tax=Lapillicoccus sp. TaxID=1909287 RepID=UPI003266F85A